MTAHGTQRPSAQRPIAVALFNDTADTPHVGCLAVSQAHRRMLRRAGAFVRHAFFLPEWRALARPTLDESLAAASACVELQKVFETSDAIVVNGEGTIHHGCGRHLLAILGAAQAAHLPTFLVNAVLQETDEAAGVLAALTDCTVRDARSAAYLRSLGIAHRVVLDSLFEAEFADAPRHDFCGRVVFTDCHPERAAEFRAELDALRAALGDRAIADYTLEAPERADDWRHALADLRGADAIVTGRHHGACLALRAGVPFVALPSNTWKLEGLLDLFDGYPRAAADVRQTLAARLAAARDARAWFEAAAAHCASALPLTTFDRLTAATSVRRTNRPPRVALQEITIRAVRTLAPPDAPVLHVGAGDGAFVASLLASGIDAHGVEAASHLLAWHETRTPGRFHHGTPAALPFPDGSFGTLVVSSSWLEPLEDDELERALKEIGRVSSDTVVIEAPDCPLREQRAGRVGRPRDWWEARTFAIGLLRHPRSFGVLALETLGRESGTICLLLQVASTPAAHNLRGRPGHDAAVRLAEFEWASRFVKPGDVVAELTALEGGADVLWNSSEAAAVHAFRSGSPADDLSRLVAPRRRGIARHPADEWAALSDASIDCFVALDGWIGAGEAHLDRLARVLSPGGRLLCALAGDTSVAAFVASLPPALLVDEVVAVTAGGGSSNFHAGQLRPVDWPDGLPARADRWLLSVLKDPLVPGAPPYVERVFPAPPDRTPNAIASARDYERPWCVHAIVTGAFRARSPRLLRDLARRWLRQVSPYSADAGAALCVLAYRELEARSDAGDALLVAIDDYCAGPAANPQARRWQISLRFVAGLLRLQRGDLARAERGFRDCSMQDAAAVTPHLATKTTEAAWLAGRIAWGRGDRAEASANWRRALAILDDVRRTPVDEWLVNAARPAAFECGDGLREIAMVVDTAALCANGLRLLADESDRWRPGPHPIERNFQRNTARLLDVVSARGGEIAALRAALDDAHAGWQTSRETLHDLQVRLEAASAEIEEHHRAALRRADELRIVHMLRKRAMKRVAIYGRAGEARRVWGVLAERGTVDIVGWVDRDGRMRGAGMAGTEVHDVAWLATADADLVAVASDDPAHARAELAAAGVARSKTMAFPTGASDGELRQIARTGFPDPIDDALARIADPAALAVGIFGTGAAGLKVWEALVDIDTADAAWFADNNPTRQRQRILWLDVIAPQEIPSRPYDAVVIGSMSRAAIHEQLRQLGIPDDRILAPDVQAPVDDIRRELTGALARVEAIR